MVEKKSEVVEAVGASTALRRGRGAELQEVMSKELQKISEECSEIWTSDLSDKEKNKRIAALQEPAEQRRRMIEAKNAKMQEIRNGS